MILSIAAIAVLFNPHSVSAFSLLGNKIHNNGAYRKSAVYAGAKDNSLFVDATSTHDSVSDYYGQTLSSSDDLKTNACVTASAPADHIKAAIGKIHPEVLKKYYGCGFCTPGKSEMPVGCLTIVSYRFCLFVCCRAFVERLWRTARPVDTVIAISP